MACPKCKSKDVKAGEKGLVVHEYVCNKCGHEYTRVSPKTKAVGTTVATAIAAAFGFSG